MLHLGVRPNCVQLSFRLATSSCPPTNVWTYDGGPLIYMIVASKGGSGWAKRRTKRGEEDKALATANNEADRKARGERLMTGGWWWERKGNCKFGLRKNFHLNLVIWTGVCPFSRDIETFNSGFQALAPPAAYKTCRNHRRSPGKFQRVSRGDFFRICGEDTRLR